MIKETSSNQPCGRDSEVLDHKICNGKQKVSEYDQKVPQSHTADQPMAP